MTEYDFNADLQFSLGERLSVDVALLKNVIPNCVSVEKTPEKLDRSGIDYIATLDGGALVYIDAKTRRKGAKRTWTNGIPRLALELWSRRPEKFEGQIVTPGKPGWTVSRSTQCDMILYTFDKSDTDLFYLIPYQHLRMAFQKHFQEWKSIYPCKIQKNKGYESEAMFVPAPIVLSAVIDEMSYIRREA